MADSDPKRIADDLERKARDMERRSEELGQRTEEVSREWQRKRSDPGVPGAPPPEAGEEDETDDG
ncbi:MAG TPA: hypothetical protein VMF57_01625 [Solirubrobacteraceae bacterium]|nr:hypothetical protein [Solirubrobacteraceae bacterium]